MQMSTPKRGKENRLELMMSKTWKEAMRDYNKPKPKKSHGLEWFMIAWFTDDQTPLDCLKALREDKEPWRAILNSVSKLKKMRTSPTHTREYQAFRWWVDRLDFECRFMQSKEQADWQLKRL